jgi:hypothetical protein
LGGGEELGEDGGDDGDGGRGVRKEQTKEREAKQKESPLGMDWTGGERALARTGGVQQCSLAV